MTDESRDTDRQHPEPDSAFSDLLGPEPDWAPCAVCGVDTSALQPLCWRCHRAEEVQKDRTERDVLCGIPKAFAWAVRGTETLRQRVKSPRTLDELEARVLGAHRVYLQGAAGSGKTSLAVACMREFLPRALFVRAERLARAPIEHRAGDGEAPLVARSKAAPLLVLDDLGTDASVSTSAIAEVVFARHDADLPTWITSGLGRAQIIGKYGTGFARRVLGDGVMALRLGRPNDPEVP